jgi:RNA polymerase sigma factor (sigma-70 family)
MAWQAQAGWARRDGRPWELEDLRQEAWLVFAEMTAEWSGDGSFVPYAMAYFPWRLRNAMRRLGPPRRAISVRIIPQRYAEYQPLHDAETVALVMRIARALSATDAAVLRLRVMEDASFPQIARQFGVSTRTIARRWARILRITRAVLHETASPAGEGDPSEGTA